MQDVNESREYLRIENNESVRLLMDVSKQHLLAPFFVGETTVADAARQAGVKNLVMFRQVKRFEALGILRVTKTESRRGRGVKYYQTAAREFFIPAKVFPLERTLEQIEASLQKVFLHSIVKFLTHNEPAGDPGTCLSLSETGTGIVAVQLALAPGKPWNPEEIAHTAIVEFWLTTNLNLEEAKELQKELSSLTERYAKKDGAQKYLLRLGLTPVE